MSGHGILPPAVQIGWRAAVLLAGAAAFVVEIAVPWEIPPATAPNAGAPPAETRPSAPRGGGAYPSIAAHPLFYPSRAPWTAAPAAAPAAGGPVIGPLDGYTLAGVVGSGASRTAILRGGAEGKSVMIGEGESLNGWLLRRIDADGLHFEAGGNTVDLGFPHAHTGTK